VTICLGGFAFWYLWRRLSSASSCNCSERTDECLSELKSWKRAAENELESQFDRIRAIAGRVDRAKRKETSQDPPGDAQSLPHDLEDQANLNRILAERFHK
jgi:hypothetical protein